MCVELCSRAVLVLEIRQATPTRQVCNYAHDNEVNIKVNVCEEKHCVVCDKLRVTLERCFPQAIILTVPWS